MNTKKLAATMAVLAMLVVALAPSALADDTVTTINLSGGSLTLDAVPTDFAFTGATVSNSSQDVPKDNSADNVTIEDLRNDASGFTLSVNATDFSGGSGNDTFADENMKIKYEDATLSTDSGAALVGSGALPTSYTAIGDAYSFWTNSASTQEAGQWSVEADFQVTIPAFTPAGTYTSTVTFTLS